MKVYIPQLLIPWGWAFHHPQQKELAFEPEILTLGKPGGYIPVFESAEECKKWFPGSRCLEIEVDCIVEEEREKLD